MHTLSFFFKKRIFIENTRNNDLLVLFFRGKHLREADQHSTHCGVSLQPLFAGGRCLHLNEEEPLFKFRPSRRSVNRFWTQSKLVCRQMNLVFYFFIFCVRYGFIHKNSHNAAFLHSAPMLPELNNSPVKCRLQPNDTKRTIPLMSCFIFLFFVFC